MNLKQQAAAEAVASIRSGMVLGLGSGSTAAYAVETIGHKLRRGELSGILGIPTSEETARQAQAMGIPLTTLAEHPVIDLAIDGADEVDPNLDLIKGLGGALLREKIVEVHARRFIVIVDASKRVAKLGTRAPLPVEVAQFAWEAQAHWLQSRLECSPQLRGRGGQPFVTDNHNFILDCVFPNGIDEPPAVAEILERRPGVVGHGLFLGMATEVIVAADDGVRHLTRPA
ncbi:MAG: ribose 5-phosphate isomerase A [Anaerolineae bacterium]